MKYVKSAFGVSSMPENELLHRCAYSNLKRPYERHAHNAHELIYVCSGTARLQIGERDYRVGPGTLVFISKLEEHSMEIVEGEYLRYFLQLTSAQLERLVEEPQLKSPFLHRFSGFSHCFDLSQDAGEAQRIFAALCAEYEAPGPYAARYVAALLQELLVLCYRRCSGQFPEPDSEIKPVVFEVQRYIDQHFTEPITVAELTVRFYLSASYLSHAFKLWTGYSPQRYLMLCRLSYARELLLTTRRSVAEITLRCGFRDESNFIRSFKKECGASPNRYRRENAVR